MTEPTPEAALGGRAPRSTVARWAIRCGIVMVLLVAVCGAALLVCRVYCGQLLEDELERIALTQEPLLPADVQATCYPPVPDDENAADAWAAAFALQGAAESPITALDVTDITPEVWESARLFHVEQEATVQAALVASARPHCRFDSDAPLTYGTGRVNERLRLSRLLESRARLAIHDRDIDSAVTVIECLLVLSAHTMEPVLIDWMARLRIRLETVRLLQELIPVDPPGEVLQQLHDRLSALDVRVFPALVSERALTHAAVSRWDRNELSFFSGERWASISGLLDADHAYYLAISSKYLRATQLPPAQILDELAQLDAELAVRTFPPKIVSGTLGFQTRFAESYLRGLAYVAAAKAALELEMDRVDTGALPTQLPADAIDPFTGEALLFIPGENGYVVYSVGKDSVDDRGVQGVDVVFEVQGEGR